jgi:hypothetical protein
LRVDDDWTLNNVGQSENVKLRSFSEILLSFLPVRELLEEEGEAGATNWIAKQRYYYGYHTDLAD